MAKAISNIDKVFDSAYLNKVYTLAKIRYNPRSYSLKDKLLALDHSSALGKSIAFLTENSEIRLLNLINENEGVGTTMVWIDDGLSPDDIAWGVEPIRTVSGVPCFMKHDDMCFKPELYLRYMDLNTTNTLPLGDRGLTSVKRLSSIKADKDETFNALLQLHIALSHPSSIANDLIWLMTEYADKPLKYVHSLQMVDEGFVVNKVPQITVPGAESAMSALVNTLTVGPVTDNCLTCAMSSKDAVHKVRSVTLMKCIVYGLEVLHALYTIHNPKFNEILENLLLRNAGGLTSLLYTSDASGKFTLASVEVQEIVMCKNPDERYELIHHFIKRHDIWTKAQTIAATDPMQITPEWLLEACAFCNENAVWNLRVQYISRLYKHCKDNGYLEDVYDTDDMEDILYGMDALGVDPYSGDIATATEDEETELLDLRPKASYKGSVTTTHGTGKISPTVEALDKLKASYRDDKYSFEVEDVVDTTPNATYTKIANTTELLNKTLIKRIKDIKVYNMGGKNPGKSKGKLDRKALYKYKTSKDIFYDNTYKVKESDLAFGLILDVSGSMHGDGIHNGVATMIVLHETLKALGINHSIITHTSNGSYNSIIKRYQAFREDKTYSTLKNYALSSITDKYGNCDSGALFYMEKALSRVRNKDKVCIMFSDGEPTECSGTDLIEQVQKMERQGIKVIGVGINYDNIKKYYNEYANGKNLNEMFEIVSNILKRYVLEKEG